MSSGKDHKNYMARLDSFLKQFTSKALIDQPDNLPEYFLESLNQALGLVLSESEHEELLSLRSFVKNHSKGKETSSSSDSDDDEVDELPMPAKSRLSTHRTSVSAEAFGAHNKREDFHPRVIAKSDSQKTRIHERLSKSFMFSVLEEHEKNIVIDAMDEKEFQEGEVVIRQGEEGNELYVVDSGKLECTKVFEGASEARSLKVYHSGEAFGELALLYNAPRAATITCKTLCKLWVLDRGTFNYIVKDAAMKKREKYEEFLGNVKVLKSLDPYERAQIADALKSANYEKDEYVIKQGDWGDVFYLIVSGTAIAKKRFYTGGPEVQVKEYFPGDYFGEIAILKGENRAASIIATSELKCVSLNRKAFQRMIGKLDDILHRNALNYVQSAPSHS
jgi:cAMP-dependent protein kinase regulator